MSRYRQYVLFLLILAILATAAVSLGTEPWGPGRPTGQRAGVRAPARCTLAP